MPTIPSTLPPVRDILEPTSNEQARSNYLERQMRQMGSITELPSDMPSLEDGMVQRPESLQERIQSFCQENKVKRKQEWEPHRMTLESMRETVKSSNNVNRTKRKEIQCMLRCYRISKELELL